MERVGFFMSRKKRNTTDIANAVLLIFNFSSTAPEPGIRGIPKQVISVFETSYFGVRNKLF